MTNRSELWKKMKVNYTKEQRIGSGGCHLQLQVYYISSAFQLFLISYPSIFDLEPKLIEFWFDGCSGKKPDYLGVQKNQQALALCPATKNCISTAENVTDITHYAPPWYACLISFLPFHRLFQCHSRVWMASGPKAPNSWRWLSWSLTKSVVKQGSCKGPQLQYFLC